MFSLFKRKPRIDDIIDEHDLLIENAINELEFWYGKFLELEREIQSRGKILPFKDYNGNLTSPNLPPGKCKIISFEYRNFEY